MWVVPGGDTGGIKESEGKYDLNQPAAQKQQHQNNITRTALTASCVVDKVAAKTFSIVPPDLR